MSLPTRFANNTTPTGPQLDGDLDALGELTTVQCTASGTNIITLTPLANAPAVTAYGVGFPRKFGYVSAGTSTGAVTVRVGALAALPLYLPSGSQAGSGDQLANNYYEIAYVVSSNYNSGAGAFLLTSATATATTPLSGGSTRNLKITNNAGTPNTQIDITAAQAILITSAGSPFFVSNVSVTCNLVATGANGMDTGARPTSGWVYLYLISTGSGVASLATATSPTSGNPTFPGGYNFYTYVGAMYCDGSQNLKRTQQKGNVASYIVVAATNTANSPIMISGASGNPATPTWTAQSVAAYVPLTAGVINGGLHVNSGTTSAIAAPNNSYGAYNSTTNPPPCWVFLAAQIGMAPYSFELESTNVYYASGGGGILTCTGWIDSWSR